MPFLLAVLLIFSFTYSKIVAKVNGRVITSEELSRTFNMYWKEILHFTPKKPSLEDKKLFLFEYIKGLIVEDIAQDMGLLVSDEEVDRKLRMWGRRKVDSILRDFIKREILIEKVAAKLTKDLKVKDSEIRAYYLLNKREFYYPDQIKLMRIIAEDRNKARKVYRLLKSGGDVHTIGEGIVIGRERWYSLQALPKSVKRRLYPYKIGKVSRPIKLETGYLILKITDKRKAGVLPLDEVKDRVRQKLLRIKKQEVLKEWFRELLKHYRLEIYLKNLE